MCLRRSTFVAWANDFGVKVYDLSTRQRVAHLPRPPLRPDQYRPSLYWTSTQLVVGWGAWAKVGLITPRSDGKGLAMQIVAVIPAEGYAICGIAPFGKDFVVLAYPDEVRFVELLFLLCC